MTLLVRALSSEDWKVLRDVRLAALLDSPDAFGSTYEESRLRPEAAWRTWPTRGQAFMAWRNGEPVGLVGIGAHWDVETATHEDGTCDLIAMWVAPHARGAGIADQLIRSALDWARAAGVPAVDLEVADGNARAERVYARHGFVRTDGATFKPGAVCMRFLVVTSDVAGHMSVADDA
jgi:ribosomal protein S18 acetylase RimI-like enzyme